MTGDWAGTVAVWRLSTGAREATLSGHNGCVPALCALTDGSNRLLSASNTPPWLVLLHDLGAAHDGAVVAPTREYRGHTSVCAALVELSGGRFASGSVDSTVRIWVTESGACLATLSGHTSVVLTLVVVDESTLVSGSYDKTLRVWDTRTYAAVATIEMPSPVWSLLSLVDGTVASGHIDGVVRLWDWRRREAVGELRSHEADKRLLGLAQLPDGRLASTSDDKTVRVWDVATRACVGVASATSSFNRCCVTADGELAVGCEDGSVLVYAFAWERRSAAVVGWVAAWSWAE